MVPGKQPKSVDKRRANAVLAAQLLLVRIVCDSDSPDGQAVVCPKASQRIATPERESARARAGGALLVTQKTGTALAEPTTWDELEASE